MIHAGEASAALSTRDGKLMKRLPEGSRFTTRGLVQLLEVRLSRNSTARAAVCVPCLRSQGARC
jgi:hypothetical protein